MIKFGTGGWRAIIADGFTKQNLTTVCSALAEMVISQKKHEKIIVIGYDRRFLSEEAARWATEVLTGYGIRCKLINRAAPTPLVMFSVKNEDLYYGIAITASHNPAIYNGIKVFTEGGRDADQSTTDELERFIAAVEMHGAKQSPIPYQTALKQGLVMEFNPHNEYIDSILALIDCRSIKKAQLKIALDPMFGVSQTSLKTILYATRSDLLVINDRHDTLFGGRLPAPNAKTLGFLSDYVPENSCDLGVATDGDADRIGVIDEKGEFVDPNKLLAILYYYLLNVKGWRGPVVRNNSTTKLLDKIAEDFGEVCYEVPVGFKHVSSKIEESGAIIGGESSGGLTVKGHILGKDGIYAAALLVELIAVTGKKLSDFYAEITERYGEFYCFDSDYHLTDEAEKQRLREKIYNEKVVPKFPHEIENISYLDGCKVNFVNGGWIIARFSGTEPLLRISCEMNNIDSAAECVKLFGELLGL